MGAAGKPPVYGLRKLAEHSEIDTCRKILASLPMPITDDPRTRQATLAGRIRKGRVYMYNVKWCATYML